MEATKGKQGLLDQILPPRLEDAGLEDCALPPDSIKEAFLKAASAVKSRATSIFTDDTDDGGDCVQDPWPEAKDVSDAIVGAPPAAGAADVLVGIDEGLDEQGSCVAEKGGGLVEDGRDEVVVGGGEIEEKERGKGCVDGGGLNKEKKDQNGDDDDEGGEGERPILTEGVV
ncbi:unnamed protein product [Linum tenue]|uniref:Uncharacterized protein n=1 Tax=Linum tenue TaxID=586396 RepID=A0AAV0KN29_9ROSI|nr:unnamed protein product [Linum tenue]